MFTVYFYQTDDETRLFKSNTLESTIWKREVFWRGINEERLARLHRLSLGPLTDTQQEAVARERLGEDRAAELAKYIRDNMPPDAETGQRVTGYDFSNSQLERFF